MWVPSRRLRLLGLATLALLAVLVAAVVTYSSVALARFGRVEARRATLMYAAPQPLVAGLHVRRTDLAGTLARLKYAETRATPTAPGQYRRAGNVWEIYLRGADGAGAQLVRLDVHDERITRVTRGGNDIGAASLEPEILASADDRPGEEHRPVRLADVPLVLLNAILAAEDHRFFEHGGLDARGLHPGGLDQHARRSRHAGRLDDHPAAHQEPAARRPTHLLAQAQRGVAGHAGRMALLQGADPRGVPQRDLPRPARRPRRPRRRRRRARVLPQGDPPAHAGGGRAPGRHGARAQQLLPHRRSRAGAGPSRRGPDAHARARDAVGGRLQDGPGRAGPRAAGGDRRAARARTSPTTCGSSSSSAGATSPRTSARGSTPRSIRCLQRFAEAAVVRGLDRLETQWPRLGRRSRARRLQAALVALDPTTGEIRALVGGRDYQVEPVQPRRAGPAAAGLGVQAVRLPRRAATRTVARPRSRPRRSWRTRRSRSRSDRTPGVRATTAIATRAR